MRPAVPTRPPRDLRLDVLRGWMQVSIFISHAFGTAFAWGIHAAWGVSDSSEQFVLLSGLVLGSVFSLKRARDGFMPATRDLMGRARRLWLTHLLVFFAFAAMVFAADMLTPLSGVVMSNGWCWLAREPWFAVPGAALGLYQPEFMGVLPIFIWCMLALPVFLFLLERVGTPALLLPWGLYAATQIFGLMPPGLGGRWIAFDPFAWQVLFMTGAWLGWRALHGAAPLPRPAWLVSLAVAVVLLGFWVKLGKHGFVPAPDEALVVLTAKDVLAPLRLAHALALAWLVSMLVPREARWMHHPAAQAMATIGRNSLQVFCLGLFLSWIAAGLFQLFPAQRIALDLALIPVGILILLAFARWREGQRPPARPAYNVATARSQ
jgi:hypothetical protein